jgi:hypothetical protein
MDLAHCTPTQTCTKPHTLEPYLHAHINNCCQYITTKPLAKHPLKIQQQQKYRLNAMYITSKQQIARFDEWRFIQGEM